MNSKKNNKEGYTIDLAQIMKALLHRAFIIVLVGVLLAGAAFVYSSFIIPPSYSAEISLYINNRTLSYGGNGFDISASDLQASQELVKTYVEFLNSRTTIERIIDRAGVDYSCSQVRDMISAGSSNETQVMRIVVTCGDPYDAVTIANGIAEVFPIRVAEIIDGASLSIVDSAVLNTQKVGPSVFKYTLLGFFIGVILMSIVVSVSAVLDDTIHSDEYVSENYDAPILARIPSLCPASEKSGGRGKLGADKFMID